MPSTTATITKKRRTFCLILLVSTASALGGQTRPARPEVLTEYSKLMQSGQAQNELTDPVARAKWIEKFENELATNTQRQTEYYHLTMKILADLYLKSGSHKAAGDLYAALTGNENVKPGLRLTAAGNTYHLAMQAKLEPAKLQEAYDGYRRLYHAFKQKNPAFTDKNAEFTLFIAEMTISRYLTDYGKEKARELFNAQKPEAAKTQIQFQEQGLKWMEQFLTKIETYPGKYATDLREGFWDRPAILYNSANLSNEISDAYGNLNQRAEWLKGKEYALKQLETLINEYPKTLFTRNGGALLVRVQQHFLTGKEYDKYIQEVSGKIVPGHEFLSALVRTGIGISADPTRLVTANSMYDLAIKLEKEWFSEEFKDHVNYQWALLEKTSNLLQLNSLEEAGKTLDVLRSLKLKGDYFNKAFKVYQDRFIEKFGVSPSVMANIDNLANDDQNSPPPADQNQNNDVKSPNVTAHTRLETPSDKTDPPIDTNTQSKNAAPKYIIIGLGAFIVVVVLIARKKLLTKKVA